MKILPTIMRKIHNFVFIEIDPFILGLYRIFLGLYFLLFFFMLAPSWLKYYGQDGLMPIRVKSILEYELFDSLLFYISSDTGLWIFYGISVICAICLIFGLLWKLPIIWLWVANYSIVWRNIAVHNSEEQVVAVLLLFSLFLPLNASLSLRSFFNKRKQKRHNTKVRVWALRLLQIHIGLIYLLSTPQKLISDYAWRDGTVVHYFTHDFLYARWPDLQIFTWSNALLSRIVGYLTLILQSTFIFIVWFRRIRVPLVLSLIFFHLGISLFMEGISMFNLAMIPGLILFLPSSETRLFFTSWKNRIRNNTLIKKIFSFYSWF